LLRAFLSTFFFIEETIEAAHPRVILESGCQSQFQACTVRPLPVRDFLPHNMHSERNEAD
jgi:hypothetical protein